VLELCGDDLENGAVALVSDVMGEGSAIETVGESR
jgi:hypothetical protein